MRGRAAWRAQALLVLALLVGGCGSAADGPVAGGPGSAPPVGGAQAAGSTYAAAPHAVTKVLTVVLENHGSETALRGMPRLAALARRYGRTTHYRAVTHPSLPNYLALAAGSTAGVRDDRAPAAHHVQGRSVFDLALAAGATATTYAESMPAPCTLSAQGRYAVKHNPWAYFSDASSRAGCRAHDVPAGTVRAGRLHDDLARGALPTVGLLVPDLCNDAHDCPLATADSWLDGWTRAVMAGPDWRSGRLALVVTFDEAERGGSNTVLTVVAAPGVRGRVRTDDLTHLSWTRWMSDLVTQPAPGRAAGSRSLGAAFGL